MRLRKGEGATPHTFQKVFLVDGLQGSLSASLHVKHGASTR